MVKAVLIGCWIPANWSYHLVGLLPPVPVLLNPQCISILFVTIFCTPRFCGEIGYPMLFIYCHKWLWIPHFQTSTNQLINSIPHLFIFKKNRHQLDGGLNPSKKIWVRQLGWWHSQLNGKIKVMFQSPPTSQLSDHPHDIDGLNMLESTTSQGRTEALRCRWCPKPFVDVAGSPHQVPARTAQCRRAQAAPRMWKKMDLEVGEFTARFPLRFKIHKRYSQREETESIKI